MTDGQPDFRLVAIGSALWIGALIAIDVQLWKFFLFLPLIYLNRVERKISIILTVCVIFGVALVQLRVYALQHNSIRALIGAHEVVQVVGSVQSDVVETPGRVIGSHRLPAHFKFALTSESVITKERSFRTRVPLLVVSNRSVPIAPGDLIQCHGRVLKSMNPKTAALLTVVSKCSLIHPASGIWRITAHLREGFRKQSAQISGDAGSLIPGMILGDTSTQSSAFLSAMRRVGLTHLTAVSGENFAIVSAFILWLLQWVIKSLRFRIAIAALSLMCFIFLVRPSPSVLRAAVMTSAMLIARAGGKKTSALTALGLAITVLIVLDPFQAQDPGFALSVSATEGIIVLSPHLAASWRAIPGKAAEFVAIPVAATIFCTPIILAISGQFSLVSIPANLLAAPVVAPITILGLIGALVAPFTPGITHILLIVISPCTQWIAGIATNFSRFPTLSISKNIFTFVILTAIVVVLATKRWLIFFLIGASLALVMWAPWAPWPIANWVFANCDVGQGDASVLNLGEHRAIVIDVGPDPILIDRCLRNLEIRSIAVLVLTHFHADHVAGLTGALRGRSVGSVWLTNLNQPSLEATLVKQTLTGITQHVVHSGTDVDIGQLSQGKERGHISVLWPGDDVRDFAAVPGDGSTINNSSIVLNVVINGIKIFLGGDIEPPVQEQVLASGKVNSVQILKVCHHGSGYQFWPLMERLRPQIAVISVGAGNKYGHPASRTLNALDDEHARILRTDRDGAIAIDNSLRIRVLKRDWWRVTWA